MNIDFGSIGINIQVIPIYGISLGVLYYNPNLEPDSDNVDQDDYFDQVTIMCLVVGLHFTIWRY